MIYSTGHSCKAERIRFNSSKVELEPDQYKPHSIKKERQTAKHKVEFSSVTTSHGNESILSIGLMDPPTSLVMRRLIVIHLMVE